MRLQTLAELNAYHRNFYAAQNERTDYLLERQYIKQFIRQNLVTNPMRGVDLFPLDAYQRLRFQPAFKSQIIEYAKSPDVAGVLGQKIRYAREPRRKAAGDGLSRRQIVARFASRPTSAGSRTKSLWNPFFDELIQLGLKPAKSADGANYEYDGKRGRLTINYRQFEKLVSELAPRRIQRLNA